MKDVSVILLAGGRGTRFGHATPKQFLSLGGKPVFKHSLEVLTSLSDIGEVIVVCEPEFQPLFKGFEVIFASPGERRQDSLQNGLKKASLPWVLIHDSARPLITRELCQKLLREGKEVGAATLGMPLKWTVKECNQDRFVKKTLDRSMIYEIQTPQLLKRHYLDDGFENVSQNNITVTDDVAFAELLGHPVKIVEGAYTNIKITTSDDLVTAEAFLKSHA